MKKNITLGYLSGIIGSFLFASCLLLLTACHKQIDQQQVLKEFQQVNLVANNGEYTPFHTDTMLINAWGLAFNATGIAWVNSQGGGVSTIYDKVGNTLRPPVAIPSLAGGVRGNPTGIVFNSSASAFVLSNKQKASFLFVGVDGILSGWNGAAGNSALLIQNNSATASYTGLAISTANGNDYLYAANFSTGTIDVWNSSFSPQSMSFTDPGLPMGYAPFNIQAVEDKLYVAYAKKGANGRDVSGVGNGIVDIFNTNGSFVKRFATGGTLNSPWGIAKAPETFFVDSNDSGLQNTIENGSGVKRQPAVLVGNFGDGRINAYDVNGKFLGQLKTENKVISIEGLWALSFAPATATAVNPNWLYFTAGPDNEQHGLFGYIVKE